MFTCSMATFYWTVIASTIARDLVAGDLNHEDDITDVVAGLKVKTDDLRPYYSTHKLHLQQCNPIPASGWHLLRVHMHAAVRVRLLRIRLYEGSMAANLAALRYTVSTWYNVKAERRENHAHSRYLQPEPNVTVTLRDQWLTVSGFRSTFATSLDVKFYAPAQITYCNIRLYGRAAPFSDDTVIAPLVNAPLLDYTVKAGLEPGACEFLLYDGMTHYQNVPINREEAYLRLQLNGSGVSVAAIAIWFPGGLGESAECGRRISATLTPSDNRTTSLEEITCSDEFLISSSRQGALFSNCLRNENTSYVTIRMRSGGEGVVSVSELQLYEGSADNHRGKITGEDVLACVNSSARVTSTLPDVNETTPRAGSTSAAGIVTTLSTIVGRNRTLFEEIDTSTIGDVKNGSDVNVQIGKYIYIYISTFKFNYIT